MIGRLLLKYYFIIICYLLFRYQVTVKAKSFLLLILYLFQQYTQGVYITEYYKDKTFIIALETRDESLYSLSDGSIPASGDSRFFVVFQWLLIT